VREFIERFIVMFSFLGVLFLLCSSSVWGPTLERWTGQDIQPVKMTQCVNL
jgi:hypothetical protein